jgi:hypothetical protein
MQTFNSNFSKSTMKNRGTPHLPKLGATESVVEVSLLDVMDVDDFLHLVKTKTDSNWKELWKETCLVVNQLKAARELLSIGSSLIGSKPSRKILDRLVEVSHIMLNAERVVIMEIDPTGSELVVTHSREERLIGLRIPSSSGIEGKIFIVCSRLNFNFSYMLSCIFFLPIFFVRRRRIFHKNYCKYSGRKSGSTIFANFGFSYKP